MKNKIKTLSIVIPAMTLALLTGCAAGSATAGYSLKAQSADSSTSNAEQRLIEKIKREINVNN